MDPRLIVGTMSGTSADGVDAAITRITGRGLDMKAELLLHHHHSYPPELREEIFAFRFDAVRDNFLSRLAKLGREISLATASAVNDSLAKAKLKSDDITAVAAHGQTLFHVVPNTIQWLDPALVARQTHCVVVSDFRRADLAAGGQGAPLVPFADYILFRDPRKNRILLNIGGIANITFLKANGDLQELIAFDTGPGNCVSDHLCRKYDPCGPGYDIGGQLALRGDPRDDLVRDHLLSAEYFDRPPPKSTDGPEMIRIFESLPLALQPHLGKHDRASEQALSDMLAMAALFTALSIANAIRKFVPGVVHEIIASGGGTQNAAMMKWLRLSLPGMNLIQSKDAGVSSEAKEAIAFALLAAATLDGFPSNVTSVTGAKMPVVLGSITPRA